MNLSLRNPLSIFPVFGICANVLAGEALRVSSFSNVLSEIAAGVGCDTVKVHAQVKPGGDPHGFQPKPAERTVFKQNSERYFSELDALKHWANAKVVELPRAGRRLVTSQDAFQYFARDFGFTIYAIEGITTADQPSAEKVTRIIEEIRLRKANVVKLTRIWFREGLKVTA